MKFATILLAFLPMLASAQTKGGGVTSLNGQTGPVLMGIINPQTGTSYTIQASDRDKLISQTSAVVSTYTVPSASSASFPSGFTFTVVNLGTAVVDFTTPSSFLPNSTTSFVLQPTRETTFTSNGTAWVIGNPSAGTAQYTLNNGLGTCVAGTTSLQVDWCLNYRTVSSGSVDALVSTDNLVIYNVSSAITVNVPQPGVGGAYQAKYPIIVRNKGTGTLTLSSGGSWTIDGGATLVVAHFVMLISDGTNWQVAMSY